MVKTYHQHQSASSIFGLKRPVLCVRLNLNERAINTNKIVFIFFSFFLNSYSLSPFLFTFWWNPFAFWFDNLIHQPYDSDEWKNICVHRKTCDYALRNISIFMYLTSNLSTIWLINLYILMWFSNPIFLHLFIPETCKATILRLSLKWTFSIYQNCAYCK